MESLFIAQSLIPRFRHREARSWFCKTILWERWCNI